VPEGLAVPLAAGAVPVDAGDDVPADEVELGSVGVAEDVPSVLDVDGGVAVTGPFAGFAGSFRLGGVPGP
jgi:hypothetical protein